MAGLQHAGALQLHWPSAGAWAAIAAALSAITAALSYAAGRRAAIDAKKSELLYRAMIFANRVKSLQPTLEDEYNLEGASDSDADPAWVAAQYERYARLESILGDALAIPQEVLDTSTMRKLARLDRHLTKLTLEVELPAYR